MDDYASEVLIHSRPILPGEPGVLVSVTKERAGWETISFSVRRLVPGEPWQDLTRNEEACLVILGGRASIRWNGSGGDGQSQLGGRADVFSGYPHSIYLPAHTFFEFTAETTCEVADGRVPSEAVLCPRLIAPGDVVEEIRGGGNATRQILDIIRPEFPADRLLTVEVYTPSGNWSSYPPHKHDVHNPPVEADLDEIYYYRVDHPDGYAFQRLYDDAGTRDTTLKVGDGDLVLIKDGYHPVVAAYGYHVYYLNILAGSARSMAATDDPRYAQFRKTWPAPDPRLPLVRR